ncbi:phosphotransferase enzyme family protein [Lysobacter korlensis]|uniref:Phosphotransferase enzyme family protein n=1 Tax=Lysobacter korlensis TaxID=553636 RepID=A0ABV6RMB2_9GAMM
MLPLSEIQRISGTVDEQWRSPVADVVAECWGLPAGTARWLRSSATHVFVVPGTSDGSRQHTFLRFAPEGAPAASRLAASAELMAGWARRGIRVVEPVPSVTGARAERVTTPIGRMVAMLVPAAEGDELAVDGLTEALASEWGAALAVLHRDGGTPAQLFAVRDQPNPRELSQGDPEFARACAAIVAAVERLDPRVHSRGTCHGDFELDNLRFGAAGLTFFDADEAHVGWHAGDVALAVRDLTGVTLGAVPRPVLLDAFLAGYRSVRAFSGHDERSLPLHSAAVSAHLVIDLRRALAAEPDDDGTDSLPELRAHLLEHLEWHHRRVLEWRA